MTGLRARNEKAAIAHLLLSGILAIIALLLFFLLWRDGFSWSNRYDPAILVGTLLFVVLPAAVNGLIAWGARRKALWARVASIIVAVLSIVFGCAGLIDMASDPPRDTGPIIFGIGLGSAFLAFGVYLLANSRWR